MGCSSIRLIDAFAGKRFPAYFSLAEIPKSIGPKALFYEQIDDDGDFRRKSLRRRG
jgi:hypothetical protein